MTTSARRGVRPPPPELRKFLAAFEPEITTLFLDTRAAVLAAAPDANELIYDAYNAVSAAYSFTDRLKEGFCHVAGYSKYVNLGFNRGAELDDPDGILLGSGARIRHVRIAAVSELRAPALQAMLRAAVRQGRELAGATSSTARSTIRPTTGGKRRPTRKA